MRKAPPATAPTGFAAATPRYGSLSFSLRRLDANSLHFKIASGVTARIILRPPLPAPLCGVSIDGNAHAAFDEHSVTIVSTPAEVICYTAQEG